MIPRAAGPRALGNRRLLCQAERVTPARRAWTLRLLPPLLWSVVIAWFSRDAWGAAETGSLLLPWLRALLPWAAPEQQRDISARLRARRAANVEAIDELLRHF